MGLKKYFRKILVRSKTDNALALLKEKYKQDYVSGKVCKLCQNNTVYYNDEYDAFYCINCNEWLEKNCGEPNCEFCKNRPEKPLEILKIS
jgi:hypothetical protein